MCEPDGVSASVTRGSLEHWLMLQCSYNQQVAHGCVSHKCISVMHSPPCWFEAHVLFGDLGVVLRKRWVGRNRDIMYASHEC
jgi:hypothetical protein